MRLLRTKCDSDNDHVFPSLISAEELLIYLARPNPALRPPLPQLEYFSNIPCLPSGTKVRFTGTGGAGIGSKPYLPQLLHHWIRHMLCSDNLPAE